MHKGLTIFLILLLVASCSSKKGTSGGIDLADVDETPVEEVPNAEVVSLIDSGLLNKEEIEISASSLYENQEQYAATSSIIANDADTEEIVVDEVIEEDNQDPAISDSSFDNQINSESQVEYVIQKNETLMLIAHKLYGDYRKWKDIKDLHTGVLSAGVLRPGVTIMVPAPNGPKKEKKGTPYLIQSGDTLGKVSIHAYQTPKHWDYIWKNNLDLIKDPNLIFAGFTLYYLPLEDAKRDLASDPTEEL